MTTAAAPVLHTPAAQVNGGGSIAMAGVDMVAES